MENMNESEETDQCCVNPENSQKRKRKHRVIWTKREDALLLAIWEDNISGLQARKNSHVYQKMGRIFKENGCPQITSREIRTKISNWTQQYKLERKKGGTSEWDYFTTVQRLIKAKRNGIYMNESSSSNFSESEMTVEALSEIDISVPASKVSARDSSGVLPQKELPIPTKNVIQKQPDPPTSDLDRTSAFKEFANEMIRIETKKADLMKEGLVIQAERNNILRGKLKAMEARNALSRERNDILRLLLIENDKENE